MDFCLPDGPEGLPSCQLGRLIPGSVLRPLGRPQICNTRAQMLPKKMQLSIELNSRRVNNNLAQFYTGELGTQS